LVGFPNQKQSSFSKKNQHFFNALESFNLCRRLLRRAATTLLAGAGMVQPSLVAREPPKKK